jgi:K+-sensing histidine kinase KdpD
MVQNQTTNFRYLAAQFFFGSIALALMTLAFFRLRIDLASTAFAYLIAIVLFSLMGSFIASALLAIMSIAGLNYFFAPPIFEFPDRQSATCRAGGGRFLAYLVGRDALDPKFAR